MLKIRVEEPLIHFICRTVDFVIVVNFFLESILWLSFYLKIEEKIRISCTNQDLCILKISKNSLAFTFVVAHKQMY